jgi:hypothetical protein
LGVEKPILTDVLLPAQPITATAVDTQPVASSIDSIDRIVFVYSLPLDSFAFDVILWPGASSSHVRE